MDIINKITIEKLADVKSNGTVRLFIGNSCVICSIYGPQSSSKSIQNGIVEVQIKFDQQLVKKFVQKKYLVKNILQDSIKLEEYPGSQIKIFLTVLINDGSILSALINAAFICLLQNGIFLNKSVFQYDLILNNQNESIIVFPTLKQLQESQSNQHIQVSMNIFTSEINYIQSSKPMDILIMDQTQSLMEKLNPLIINFLKNYVDIQ